MAEEIVMAVALVAVVAACARLRPAVVESALLVGLAVGALVVSRVALLLELESVASLAGVTAFAAASLYLLRPLLGSRRDPRAPGSVAEGSEA